MANFTELKVGNILYTLDNVPEQSAWVVPSTLQPLLDSDLLNVVGYADCFSYPELSNVKFAHWYWQVDLEPQMLGVGKFFLAYGTKIPVRQLLEENKPLDITLVLLDKNYVCERLLRELQQLQLDKDELLDFLTNEFSEHYNLRATALEEQKIKTWLANAPVDLSIEQVKSLIDIQKKKASTKAK